MGISWPCEYPPSPRLSPAAALEGNSAPAMESSATALETRGVEGMTFMMCSSLPGLPGWFVLRSVERGAEETRSLFFWPQISLVGIWPPPRSPQPTNHGRPCEPWEFTIQPRILS